MTAGGSAGDEADRLRREAEELRRRAAAKERRAAAFESGQRGELAVAQVLDSLAQDGYRHIDDVTFPGSKRANIDHVLIGPAGVFIIDAKEWGGRAEVRDGVFRHNGYRRTDKLETIISGARAVEQRAGLPEHAIYPVACLTGKASVAPTLVGGCTVASLPELADNLRAMPARLTPEQVAWAYERLDVVLERKAELKASPAPNIVRRAAQNARAGRPAPSAPAPVRTVSRTRRAPRQAPVVPRPHAARHAQRRATRAVATGAHELGGSLIRLAIGVVLILVLLGGLSKYLAKQATNSLPKPNTTTSTPPAHTATPHR